MLETIRELLSANGTGPDGETPSPKAVREAIDEAEAELERARDRLDELNERHGRVLLHGSDDVLDDHERKIELTEREIARLETAREELGATLEVARKRQEVEERQATMDEAREAQTEGGALLAEFAEHAGEMVGILERIEELDAVVSAAEQAYRQADREIKRELDPPDDGFLGPARPNGYNAPPITESTEIPPVGPDAPRWGSVRWREPRAGSTPTPSGNEGDQRPAGVYDAETGERIDRDAGVVGRRTVAKGI